MNIADKPYAELMAVEMGLEGWLFRGMLKAAKVLPPERVVMMNTVALVALGTNCRPDANRKDRETLRAFFEEARWKSL